MRRVFSILGVGSWCLGLGMWECCRKVGMVSSAGASVWGAGMDWEVGVSGVKGLKSGLGKHGACSGDGGEGGCI